jgi:uncharacterized protein YndB with AHSA1/START domain
MGARIKTREIVASDRIHKTMVLHATRGRVWLAISDAKEFGAWFGAVFDRPFTRAATVTGRLARPAVAADFAELEPYFGTPIELVIEHIEPDRLVSFIWHPFAVDRDADYGGEAPTVVSLEIEDDPDGVVLTITESGFAYLPPARRAAAYVAHERAWEQRMLLIKRRVEVGRFGPLVRHEERVTESRARRQ